MKNDRMKNRGMRLTLAALLTTFFACGPISEEDIARQRRSLETIKVAAIQYGHHAYSSMQTDCGSSATPDMCAVKELVVEAHALGATMVVTPEEMLEQEYYESMPAIGDVPADATALTEKSLLKIFSKQARELQIYIMINPKIKIGTKVYTSMVSFGPDGAVVGVHHKFEIWGGHIGSIAPGTEVSVFDSPLGKVGTLVCADIYGDFRLHDKLTRELGARVVFVSSAWSVNGAANWGKNFAKNWGVYVAYSNVTADPGYGGGIYDPEGNPLDESIQTTPAVTIAEIPIEI